MIRAMARAGGGLRTFNDAVAIVTGAGSGIGEALATALAVRGAFVLVTDRRGQEAGRVAGRINGSAGRAEPLTLDVRDPAAVEAAVAETFARHGRLDYLFNNAGIGIGGEVKDLTLEDWRQQVEVNILGVVHGVHAAYPRMVQQGFGHIVNTASMAGLMPGPLLAGYTMTKHAVVGLTRSLRAEGHLYGVRASVLCPGVVRTPIITGGAFGGFSKRPTDERMESAARWLRAMPADVFATKVLRQVARNVGTIIVPTWWRAIAWVQRSAPRLGDWLAARAFRLAKPAFDEGTPRGPR